MSNTAGGNILQARKFSASGAAISTVMATARISFLWTLRLPNGEIEWREHNHEATYILASHISLRRQAIREVGEEIRKFFQLKTLKPADIYHTLHRVHDNTPVCQKDIYNLLHRWRKAQRQGLDVTQALILDLDHSEDWLMRYWPSEGPIERLFLPIDAPWIFSSTTTIS